MTDNTDKIDHNRVVQTAQAAAIKRRNDLYERAYLAALTGLLASGNYDAYGASVDAHDCATKAVDAIERAAGGER